MFNKLTLLSIVMIAVLGACAVREGSSNNNDSESNNNSNNNNTPIGWVLVGEANISGGEAKSPILRFYNSTPYVAFLDISSGNTGIVRVMKYDDATGWENVGGNISSDGSTSLAFEIDSTNGDLYVAYSDGGTTPTGKIAVKKYDGVSWNDVAPITSANTVAHVAMTLLGGTTPYVAYYDTATGEVLVRKYTSGAWSAGFTGLAVEASYVSLTSSDSNIFLSTIITSSSLISIKKYNTSDFGTIISVPVAHKVKEVSTFVDGIYLYVSVIDLDHSNQVLLSRYNTTTPGWSVIGTSAYISDGSAEVPSLYARSNGLSHDVAYVAYRDTLHHASVKFCLDDPAVACAELGGIGFSDTTIMSISIAYSGNNPYVAYVNTTTNGIEVRKY
jgi:hypothetical protein